MRIQKKLSSCVDFQQTILTYIYQIWGEAGKHSPLISVLFSITEPSQI